MTEAVQVAQIQALQATIESAAKIICELSQKNKLDSEEVALQNWAIGKIDAAYSYLSTLPQPPVA